jgi:hypothetical protein
MKNDELRIAQTGARSEHRHLLRSLELEQPINLAFTSFIRAYFPPSPAGRGGWNVFLSPAGSLTFVTQAMASQGSTEFRPPIAPKSRDEDKTGVQVRRHI